MVLTGQLTGSCNIQLSNLQQGVPVHIILSSTGTNSVTVSASRPSGSVYTVIASGPTFGNISWNITPEVVSAGQVLQAISLGGTTTGLYFTL